jgi:hypothetical protein
LAKAVFVPWFIVSVPNALVTVAVAAARYEKVFKENQSSIDRCRIASP